MDKYRVLTVDKYGRQITSSCIYERVRWYIENHKVIRVYGVAEGKNLPFDYFLSNHEDLEYEEDASVAAQEAFLACVERGEVAHGGLGGKVSYMDFQEVVSRLSELDGKHEDVRKKLESLKEVIRKAGSKKMIEALEKAFVSESDV